MPQTLNPKLLDPSLLEARPSDNCSVFLGVRWMGLRFRVEGLGLGSLAWVTPKFAMLKFMRVQLLRV